MPTIFKRNPNNRSELTDEVNEGCLWVFNGEGVATRKYDGTCCLIEEGKLYKRREVKKYKEFPVNFLLADKDLITGKTVGWVPVDSEDVNDRWHVEAFTCQENLKDGTYELLGPKIQGNPECFDSHVLFPHLEAGRYVIEDRTFKGIKLFLEGMDIEGVVFQHKDGRMAKIKKRDFHQSRKGK